MTSPYYENLIKTATWWAVVDGEELPLCNGHGHPEVLSPEGKEIQIPSGTLIYQRNEMYMLRLSQQQLELLMIVDMQDDWHPAYFLKKVAEYYESNQEKTIERNDFENMMARLKMLTTGKIANLQIALNILANL